MATIEDIDRAINTFNPDDQTAFVIIAKKLLRNSLSPTSIPSDLEVVRESFEAYERNTRIQLDPEGKVWPGHRYYASVRNQVYDESQSILAVTMLRVKLEILRGLIAAAACAAPRDLAAPRDRAASRRSASLAASFNLQPDKSQFLPLAATQNLGWEDGFGSRGQHPIRKSFREEGSFSLDNQKMKDPCAEVTEREEQHWKDLDSRRNEMFRDLAEERKEKCKTSQTNRCHQLSVTHAARLERRCREIEAQARKKHGQMIEEYEERLQLREFLETQERWRSFQARLMKLQNGHKETVFEAFLNDPV